MTRSDQERSMHGNSRTIGLVVGAGGPTGGPFIHAALREIELATGWVPSAARTIVGTSAGAFVAASIGASPLHTSAEQFAALSAMANARELPAGFHHRAASVVRRWAGALIAAIAPSARPFAEYRVPASPYHPGSMVVTVRRRRGGRVVHQLVDAEDPQAVVRASAAIPGLNKPVRVSGRDHVDGAVHSAANADVVPIDQHDCVIVIAPMVSASGGSIAGRFHRAQLRTELHPWLTQGKPALVIVPTATEHADRRDRDAFEAAGRSAVARLRPKPTPEI
jgi:predicted acylesterase/phospholipase RssA